jgi:hypothetical protein
VNRAFIAAHNLRIDHTIAEVLRALDDVGVDAVLLKGPSTRRWLYAENPRMYQDCDLLVSPATLDAAERVLRGLGFAPTLEQRKMPEWWREHAVEWVHPELAGVDLHRTLKGVGVDDARLWDVLGAETDTMVVGGHPITILSAPARALVLALNSAGDGFDNGDLARAVGSADRGTWERAAELARRLDATAWFATGLRLGAMGDALADELGLPRPSSIEAALRGRARPPALTIDRLARASGTRERVAIVARKLLPPPTFMRHWSPTARRGRAGLLWSYVERLIWVARTAPSAVRAWKRARKSAQSAPPDEA